MIEFKDVFLECGGKAILQGENVFLDDGESLCIIGSEASGGTSVLLAVEGLLPLTGGYITIDGERVGRLSAPWFRKDMLFVGDGGKFDYRSVGDMLRDVFALRVNRRLDIPMKLIKGELAALGVGVDVVDKRPDALDRETLQRVMMAVEGVVKRRFVLFDNMTDTWGVDYLRPLKEQGVTLVATTTDEAVAGVFDKKISL